MCFRHWLSLLLFVFVSQMELLTLNEELLTSFLIVLSMTLPAAFMLFLYPCVVFSMPYALECSKDTLWIELLWFCFEVFWILSLILVRNFLYIFHLWLWFMSRLPEWRCSSSATGRFLSQRTDDAATGNVWVLKETNTWRKSHSPGALQYMAWRSSQW